MTQEQKDLLIKDLCGRLSYGVKCKILETNEVRTLGSIQYDGENTLFDFWNDNKKQYEYQLYLSEFKPYLFPISSMTKEQSNELYSCFHDAEQNEIKTSGDYLKAIYMGENAERDYLNKNHLDYHYLIPMGLANDATGLNIY